MSGKIKNRWLAASLIAGLMIVLLISACNPVETPRGEIISMANLTFTPSEVTIQAGTTVTWQNSDLPEHTVTSGTSGNPSRLFDETILAGEEFTFTFTEPGRYEYFCKIHPDMNGVVIVEYAVSSSKGLVYFRVFGYHR